MDSRFNLKLKFHIYDKDFEWDCSLNWSAEEGRIDNRITEFFINAHDSAKAEWDDKNYEHEQKRRERLEVEHEKETLKRLRKKYPTL